MTTELLVTGYGPFGSIKENPSEWLASNIGLRHQILPVSFEAVDEFLTTMDSPVLLSLGVHSTAKCMHLEWIARNQVAALPDALGVVREGEIETGGPEVMATTLWLGTRLDDGQLPDGVKASTNAGTYLCNYILYRSLRLFPDRRVGFLHVPTFTVIPAKKQLEILEEVVSVFV
ncbi:MAG: hypothetical protein ACOYON_08940 [Fimbriimonas sp.]